MFIQATTGCSPQSSSSWPETWSALSVFCSTCPPCLSLPSSGQPGSMPLWVHLPQWQGNMSVPETRLYHHYRQAQFSPSLFEMFQKSVQISKQCVLSKEKRKRKGKMWWKMCRAAPDSFGYILINHFVQKDTYDRK